MDLLLIHNPGAGSEDHSGKALRAPFEEAGHRVRYQSTEAENWKAILAEPADAIVAVGGDGTIRRVIITLAEAGLTRVPVAILAKGTANNIATSVGAPASAHELADKLTRARRRQLAVGTVRGPLDLTGRFVESAGVGVFARLLRKAADRNLEEVEQGLKLFRQTILKAEPAMVRIWADDEDVSGEYLLVEAMNIASIGPQVALAPAADYSDDKLELVLVQPEDREALVDYIDSLGNGDHRDPPVSPRQVRQMRIHWETEGGHLDDTLWPKNDTHPGKGLSEFRIEIETRIPLLVP